MPKVEIDLPVLHDAQRVISEDESRFRVVCCGRRFGKSLFAGAEVFIHALMLHMPCWWAVPTFNNALDAWRMLQELAAKVPGKVVSKEEMQIDFPGGGFVRVVSMHNYDSVRGSGLGFVVFDECAYAPEGAWFDLILPAIMDKVGRVLLISTPNGYNWYYREYMRGLRGEDGFKSFHYTSWDNPHIPRESIELNQKIMPEKKYRQEVMAEFVADALSVFRGIGECVMEAPPPYDESHVYVMGVDWGRKHDFTAISVWDSTLKQEVHLDKFSKLGFDFQRERIKMLADLYGVSTIIAEENGIGMPNVERLQVEGMPVQPFKMTLASKKPLVEAFALAVEKTEVGLLNDDAANHELAAYEESVSPKTGVIRYNAPEGEHDDTVIARMLAYHAMGTEIGDILFLEW